MRKKKKRKTYYNPWKVALFLIICAGIACYMKETGYEKLKQLYEAHQPHVDTADDVLGVPEYSGNPYVEINQNQPLFREDEMVTDPFECYSELDELGRCGAAYVNVCREIMPEGERGDIGNIRPTGWKNRTYKFIENEFVYHRCHLAAYELTGENDNAKNLITGTQYLNFYGMLPFENMVANYVYGSGNHVLYRVTPIFHGNDLLASGVEMEAKSVEDNGAGICFHVYVYNVQPGIVIDYRTGENWEEKDE